MTTPSTWQRQGRGSTAHYTLSPIPPVRDETVLPPAANKSPRTKPTNFNPQSIDPSEQATYGVPNPALGAFVNERENVYPGEDGTLPSADYGPGLNPNFRDVDYNGESPLARVDENSISRKPVAGDWAHHGSDRGHARDGVGGMGHVPLREGQEQILQDLGEARTGVGGIRHVRDEGGNMPVQDHGHPRAGVGGMGHVYAEDGAMPLQDHGHPRAGVGGMGHVYAEDGKLPVQDHGHATEGVGGMGHIPLADAEKQRGGRRSSLMDWVHKHTGSK